jgi:photosystem II stability/assembly factor-like uncharacterized protein
MHLLRYVVALILASGCARAAEYVWKNVAIGGGGYVTGIEYHPAEPGLAYARTDVGGVYRRDSATGPWVALNDWVAGLDNGFMDLGVLSVGLDPADPDRVYLACGQYLEWWAPPARFMSSSDRGATWSNIALPFKLGGNLNGRGTGERLAVDPHDGTRIFLGTSADGLWRSTDRGATWTRLTAFTPAATTFVLCDPDHAGTLYVGAAQTDGPTLWKSTDRGETWAAVEGQPSGLFALQGKLDPAGDLFLTYSDQLGPNGVTSGAVWKYSAAGTWTNLNVPTGQGGFGGVAVDPNLPGRVVVSTLSRWWPGDEIYRSNDGGQTWTGVLYGTSRDYSSAPWAATLAPHWLSDVEIDPFDSGRASFVTGYGLYSTSNLGAAPGQPAWSFDCQGLEECVPQALVSPAAGPPLVSVIGDFDGFRHDNLDASPALGRHSPSKGTTYALDGAGMAPAVLAKSHGATGSISRDGGVTWTDFPAVPPTAAEGRSDLAVSADGTRILWCPKASAAYVSADDGATWTPCAGSPTGDLWPVADRVDPLRFTILDPATRTVHVSTDGGVTFTAGDSDLPSGSYRIEAVPGQTGHLWLIAWNGGLWRSTDGGADFAQVTSVQRGYQAGFGRSADGTGHPAVFLWGRVGGIDGLFRSDDTGATWQRINDSLHQFGHINDLTGDPRAYGRVYLGTSGRGIIVGEEKVEPRSTEMIYQDGLAEGWQNWSWATVNLSSAAPVRRGSSAVSVTAGGWETLYLARPTFQKTAGYAAVAFWIHGGETGGQTLQVIALRDGVAQTPKEIPAPTAQAWTRVVIPLAELGVAGVDDFNGLWIQNASASALSAFHVDDIALIGEADAHDWSALDWTSWRQSQFSAAELADDSISGPDADSDHDGRSNRVEWHLLGNTRENDFGPWCGWQLQDDVVTLSYDRRAGFPSAMTLEVSADLEFWTLAEGAPTLLPLDASGLRERVTWTLPSTAPALFFRLR